MAATAPCPFPPRPPKDRGFLADEPLRPVVRDGQPGLEIKVRLTSYRSLPLSCIESIALRLDGREIDPQRLVLSVAGGRYRLGDLGALTDVWWFILDYADLYVPLPAALAAGEHDVEATLVTVEPYMTAGRFSFHNSSRKRLALEDPSGGTGA